MNNDFSSRYSDISQSIRWDGKQIYTSVTYPVVVPQDSDIIIVTDETTYLDTLAYKYYGYYSLYWIIVIANSGLGDGRLSVKPGTTLRIPSNVSSVLAQYQQLNS